MKVVLILVIIIIFFNSVYCVNAEEETENAIYDDRFCHGSNGCIFKEHSGTTKIIETQTGKEVKFGKCILHNATITSHCFEDWSYFGHAAYTTRCSNNQFTHSQFCSNKNYSKFTENKDCMVPTILTPGVEKWAFLHSEEVLKRGTYVEENQSGRIICDLDYRLPYGNTGTRTCQSGKWIFEKSDDCRTEYKDQLFCEGFGCILPNHPKNGKWIDSESTAALDPGRCVRKNTTVTASCDLNFSYFEKKNFVYKCGDDLEWIGSGFCTNQLSGDYKEDKDCVVPDAVWNSKWVLDHTNETILSGHYVRNNTAMRAVCDSNYVLIYDSSTKCSSGQWARYNSRCIPIDSKDFQANKECVVPVAANNTKWVQDGTEKEILPGGYVAENTKLRAMCDTNFELVHGTEDVTICKSGRWSEYGPICLDLSRNKNNLCQSRGGCVLTKHPDHGKWVDKATGNDLQLGICIQAHTFVNASCDKDYNYFGYKKFLADCFFSKFSKDYYSCSDQSYQGFDLNKDCVVPAPPGHSKWTGLHSSLEILPGTYVKENQLFSSVCFPNFTSDGERVAQCVQGKWEYSPAECRKIHVEEANKTPNDCLTPGHPDNGKLVTYDSQTLLTPGKYVNELTRVILVCDKHHKHFLTFPLSTCLGGKWQNIEAFFCQGFCDSLNSTEQYKVTCIFKNKRRENCTEPLEGAVAEITCQSVYQNQHIWESRSKIRVCLRGKWDNSVLPSCIPKTQCGLKAPNLLPLIVHGTTVAKGGYPWHVVIYHKKKETFTLICGGSLISDKLIITAAHCITNVDGKLLNETNYHVAVGKHFPGFNDSRDEYSQTSTITKMIIPDTYKGALKNFVSDIAILIAAETFNLHEGVLPICLNFGTDRLEEIVLADKKRLGYLPGFGITETGKISEILKEIFVPLVKHENCSKYLPEDFIEYYSYDKFCAGYLNQSSSACSGDSGGGLVVQNPLDDRFYLIGVVSVSPRDVDEGLQCDIQQYTLYTKVSDYIDYIRDEGEEYLEIKTDNEIDSVSTTECRKYVLTLPDTSLHLSYFNIELNSIPPGDLPFLAIIGTERENQTQWFCTGSLISDRFILTAASCSLNKSLASIVVQFDTYNPDKKKTFQVETIFVSPEYKPPEVYNDLSLFKLAQKVEFTDSVYPACLDTETNFDSKRINVENLTSLFFGDSSDVVKLQSQTSDVCEPLFRRSSQQKLPEGFVAARQFCVDMTTYFLNKFLYNYCDLFPGTPFPIVKTDSRSGRNYYRIAGITSDFKECPRANNLMLFTKISDFIPWIESIVWP